MSQVKAINGTNFLVGGWGMPWGTNLNTSLAWPLALSPGDPAIQEISLVATWKEITKSIRIDQLYRWQIWSENQGLEEGE